jgi:hypothetical protein
MRRLKEKQLGEGLHPSEVFVSVETRDGPQDLAVDPSSFKLAPLLLAGRLGKKVRICWLSYPDPRRLVLAAWVRKDELIQDKTLENEHDPDRQEIKATPFALSILSTAMLVSAAFVERDDANTIPRNAAAAQ